MYIHTSPVEFAIDRTGREGGGGKDCLCMQCLLGLLSLRVPTGCVGIWCSSLCSGTGIFPITWITSCLLCKANVYRGGSSLGYVDVGAGAGEGEDAAGSFRYPLIILYRRSWKMQEREKKIRGVRGAVVV